MTYDTTSTDRIEATCVGLAHVRLNPGASQGGIPPVIPPCEAPDWRTPPVRLLITNIHDIAQDTQR